MRPIGISVLIDLLAMVDRRVLVGQVLRWSPRQRAAAEQWAVAVYLRASDNPVRVPRIPRHVERLPTVRQL